MEKWYQHELVTSYISLQDKTVDINILIDGVMIMVRENRKNIFNKFSVE